MRDVDLVRLQTLLDFRLGRDGRLSAFPWGEPGDVPRLELLRTAGGYFLHCGASVPGEVEGAVRAMDPATAFATPSAVARVLGAEGPGTFRRERRYHFPTVPAGATAADLIRVGEHFVLLDGERPRVWAWTVREHLLGKEAGVAGPEAGRGRTAPARQALGGWVAHTVGTGKVAFFRHRVEDRWARRLVRALGGVEFARSVVFR